MNFRKLIQKLRKCMAQLYFTFPAVMNNVNIEIMEEIVKDKFSAFAENNEKSEK